MCNRACNIGRVTGHVTACVTGCVTQGSTQGSTRTSAKKLLVLLDELGGLEELGDGDLALHQDAEEFDLLDPRVPEAALLRAVDVVLEELHAAQREAQGLRRRQAELGLAARHPASLALADVHFAESADSDVVLGRGDGVD